MLLAEDGPVTWGSLRAVGPVALGGLVTLTETDLGKAEYVHSEHVSPKVMHLSRRSRVSVVLTPASGRAGALEDAHPSDHAGHRVLPPT